MFRKATKLSIPCPIIIQMKVNTYTIIIEKLLFII